jgi:glyoxylase-like metal-dependent hydrolase (beta-lactamase superfamily II)
VNRTAPPEALSGLTVFERGWLSSNNVLIHEAREGEGAVLVDTSHCLHGDQTIALLRSALRPGERLAAVVNTHLHSDHCGGNAAVQRAFGQVPVFIPDGPWQAVHVWDEDALSYRATGQRCERFTASGTVTPDERLRCGGRDWQVLAAPGHDPDSVILFDARHGVLLSADALWENGVGVIFPELEGESAFDDAAAVLDLIETLPAAWVVPGHGAPFRDVAGALQRARQRVDGWRRDPMRHARHAAKVLLKYHLLEEQRQSVTRLHLWAGATPLLREIWTRLGCPSRSLHVWCDELVGELVTSGAAAREGTDVLNT